MIILVPHFQFIVQILFYHVIIQHHQQYLHRFHFHVLMIMMVQMIMEILWIKNKNTVYELCIFDKRKKPSQKILLKINNLYSYIEKEREIKF